MIIYKWKERKISRYTLHIGFNVFTTETRTQLKNTSFYIISFTGFRGKKNPHRYKLYVYINSSQLPLRSVTPFAGHERREFHHERSAART